MGQEPTTRKNARRGYHCRGLAPSLGSHAPAGAEAAFWVVGEGPRGPPVRRFFGSTVKVLPYTTTRPHATVATTRECSGGFTPRARRRPSGDGRYRRPREDPTR